ncbi:unnamed protein product [Arctogadus glacialis]
MPNPTLTPFCIKMPGHVLRFVLPAPPPPASEVPPHPRALLQLIPSQKGRAGELASLKEEVHTEEKLSQTEGERERERLVPVRECPPVLLLLHVDRGALPALELI